MKKLAILGGSGHGRVVADTALISGWGSVTFFDDAWPQLTSTGHWPVVGDSMSMQDCLHEFDGVVVAIGNCAIRLEKHKWLQSVGATMVTLIHPAATVSQFAQVGAGSVVMAGAVVQTYASIGEAGIVNTGASVDHDCFLADAVHICPGAHLSGGVSVGAGSWVGVGAVIKQGVNVGTGSIIGAGAVVIHPVPKHVTVVGNPGKVVHQP